jgi:hypothetical protein
MVQSPDYCRWLAWQKCPHCFLRKGVIHCDWYAAHCKHVRAFLKVNKLFKIPHFYHSHRSWIVSFGIGGSSPLFLSLYIFINTHTHTYALSLPSYNPEILFLGLNRCYWYELSYKIYGSWRTPLVENLLSGLRSCWAISQDAIIIQPDRDTLPMQKLLIPDYYHCWCLSKKSQVL